MTLFDHLPPAATWGGYIYIVAFDNPLRTIKVGSTKSPHSRLGAHRLDADVFGHQIADSWVSQEHANYLKNENVLIVMAASMCTGRARREYFHGVDFDALVEATRVIDFAPKPDPDPPHIIAARVSGAERLAQNWAAWKTLLPGSFYTFAEIQEMTGMPLELVIQDFSGGMLPTGATGEVVAAWVAKHQPRCGHRVPA